MRGASLVLLTGCLKVTSTPGEPIDEMSVCVVTYDSNVDDRLDVQLEAPERPSVAVWYRNSELYEQYTFSYDEAGRLLESTEDRTGPDRKPDGVADYRRRLVHTATSTAEELLANDGSVVEMASYTLDANDRQTSFMSRNKSAVYQVGDGGRLERSEVMSRNVELMPITTTTVWDYDGAGRPVTRTETRSDAQDMPWTIAYTYDEEPGALTVRANDQSYRYEYADGHITRIEWSQPSSIAVYTYATKEDGTLAVTMRRDLNPAVLVEASAGCHMEPTLPSAPTAPDRPGPIWRVVAVPAPGVYD